MRYVTAFLSKFSLNLSIEEEWRNAVNKAKKSFVSGGFTYKAFPFVLPDTIQGAPLGFEIM